MKEINIAELLKDAPKGTKLYSPLFGDCELDYYVDNCTDKIVVKSEGKPYIYGIYGQLLVDNYRFSEECLLFPSKDCRTWGNFKASWKHKHFEPFQKVLVVCEGRWGAALYSHLEDDDCKACHYTTDLFNAYTDDNILPYSGNEDKLGKEVEQ